MKLFVEKDSFLLFAKSLIFENDYLYGNFPVWYVTPLKQELFMEEPAIALHWVSHGLILSEVE